VEEPPSLSRFQARLSPLATLGEEAELIFADPLYDYLVKFNLERYTVNRPKTEQQSTINRSGYVQAIRKEYQNGYLNPSQIRNRRRQWEPTKGVIPEGKGGRGCLRASLPPLSRQ
jgi:hypothetical protein